MRDDARFLTLLFVRAPPPCPVNKVHQTLLSNGRIFYLSKSRYELQLDSSVSEIQGKKYNCSRWCRIERTCKDPLKQTRKRIKQKQWNGMRTAPGIVVEAKTKMC